MECRRASRLSAFSLCTLPLDSGAELDIFGELASHGNEHIVSIRSMLSEGLRDK